MDEFWSDDDNFDMALTQLLDNDDPAQASVSRPVQQSASLACQHSDQLQSTSTVGI